MSRQEEVIAMLAVEEGVLEITEAVCAAMRETRTTESTLRKLTGVGVLEFIGRQQGEGDLETLARIAHALGRKLQVRLVPRTTRDEQALRNGAEIVRGKR